VQSPYFYFTFSTKLPNHTFYIAPITEVLTADLFTDYIYWQLQSKEVDMILNCMTFIINLMTITQLLKQANTKSKQRLKQNIGVSVQCSNVSWLKRTGITLGAFWSDTVAQ
jgi:hypothetical protein